MPRGEHLKGKPRTPGSGRRPGSENLTTRTIKQMIEAALHEAGGVAYLVQMAHQEPAAFMALLGKIIPRDIKAELTGANGGPIEIGRGVPRLTKAEWMAAHGLAEVSNTNEDHP